MKNFQKGFTLVETLLIILVVSFIAFAGWYVYNANQDDSASKADTSTTKLSETEDKKDQLPEGYVKFSNKTSGVTFAYPEEWGAAKLENGPESSHLVKGSEYKVSFDRNESITGGLLSKDWEHDAEKGHGGMLYAGAYVKPRFNYTDYKGNVTITEHQNTASTTLFSGPLLSLGCEGVGTVLIQKIDGNNTFESIAFMYFDKKIDFNNPDDTLCDSYKNYISQTHIDELKQVGQTVKNY